jgi:hypothetical protein
VPILKEAYRKTGEAQDFVNQILADELRQIGTAAREGTLQFAENFIDQPHSADDGGKTCAPS